MGLAIFDLDNTLIDGDCVEYWVQYCVDTKMIENSEFKNINKSYMELYEKGEMNIVDYIEFSMKSICDYKLNELNILVNKYVDIMIKPIIYKKSELLVSRHKENYDHILVISASPEFLVRPIAKLFGIDDIIGIKLEKLDNRYKNNIIGIAPYQEGKVKCLNEWLEDKPEYNLNNSFFYSDSHNDIPLLGKVNSPVATNPDTKLAKHAKKNGWDIIQTTDI